MSDPISLAEARAVNAEDAKLWSPLDALKALIRDIEAGEVSPTWIAVHWLERQEGGNLNYGYSIAGMSRAEHIALLSIAQANAIEGWRK